jgi:CRP/FNR family cyclic AMP-dependent transcriptional regulator
MPGEDIFSTLSPDHLALIAEHGVTRQYAKSTVLITEGDQSDSLYVINSGKVRVYLSDENGKEFTLNVHAANEYFGELALFGTGKRSASVITLEPSQIAVVSKNDFVNCLGKNPDIAFELIRALSDRLRELTENVRNLALRDVYGRVACTLLSQASERDGERVIEPRPTHQEIANMVGASREMVSRIMRDLTTGGYLEVREGKILIRNKLPNAW